MAQNVMSPETLWKLGRVSALGISKDSKNVVYKVTTPIEENKSNSKFYVIPVNGGSPTEVQETGSTKGQNISPDGKYLVYSEEVKINDVLGKISI
jgi:Tol biopolymer transport system component